MKRFLLIVILAASLINSRGQFFPSQQPVHIFYNASVTCINFKPDSTELRKIQTVVQNGLNKLEKKYSFRIAGNSAGKPLLNLNCSVTKQNRQNEDFLAATPQLSMTGLFLYKGILALTDAGNGDTIVKATQYFKDFEYLVTQPEALLKTYETDLERIIKIAALPITEVLLPRAGKSGLRTICLLPAPATPNSGTEARLMEQLLLFANNSLVSQQPNYYFNYLQYDASRKTATPPDITISLEIKQQPLTPLQYNIHLQYKGSNLSLGEDALQDVQRNFSIDKTRIDSGDYTEALYKIHRSVQHFLSRNF
jgi:hypothetical protein